MNGTFLLQCLPFPDEQKTIYFAVFFPSLRDGDKSNHFGELKKTNPSQLFENICPATLANEHLDDPAIFFTSEAMQPLHTSTHFKCIINHSVHLLAFLAPQYVHLPRRCSSYSHVYRRATTALMSSRVSIGIVDLVVATFCRVRVGVITCSIASIFVRDLSTGA
jgi:hypothetical protein